MHLSSASSEDCPCSALSRDRASSCVLLSCQLSLDCDNKVTEQSYQHHQVLGHVMYKETQEAGLVLSQEEEAEGRANCCLQPSNGKVQR